MASDRATSNERDVELATDAAATFGRAFTDGEVDAFLALLAVDVDFEVPSVMQSAVMKLSGHDEVRDYLERTAGEYEELQVQSKEIRDVGGGRFLMLGSWQATPHRSPTKFGTPMGAVIDIRDAKVTRLQAFFDEQLAIEAAARR